MSRFVRDSRKTRMKKLFIYYSLSGNGDLVAETLASKGYEIRKVVPQKKAPESFFFRILAGGFGAGIGRKEPLAAYDPDVTGYDQVVIGTPIWNGRVSCPVNTVLSETDLSGKELAFVLYSGSGEAPKTLERINDRYPGATVIHLKEPKTRREELEKLKDL